jgi:hypothetical protein
MNTTVPRAFALSPTRNLNPVLPLPYSLALAMEEGVKMKSKITSKNLGGGTVLT